MAACITCFVKWRVLNKKKRDLFLGNRSSNSHFSNLYIMCIYFCKITYTRASVSTVTGERTEAFLLALFWSQRE